MKCSSAAIGWLWATLWCVSPPVVVAAPVELFAARDAREIKTEECTVRVENEAGNWRIEAEVPASSGYPGFDFPAPKEGWDLSAYAGVQVDVTNGSNDPLSVALRVDNAGDWRQAPWNTESVYLKPGETKTLKVTFGRSYGKPGYALDPRRIVRLKVFAVQPKQPATITVKKLKPFGKSE